MRVTPAGARDRKIEFQRATSVRSALGGKSATSWTALGLAWAKVLYGTGAERRGAAVEQAVQAATFRVLSTAMTRGVLATDRIVHDGRSYDITGIAPIGRTEIEFTGTASRG